MVKMVWNCCLCLAGMKLLFLVGWYGTVVHGEDGLNLLLWWAGLELLLIVGWYRTVVYGGLV